jgi:hypothetical protein
MQLSFAANPEVKQPKTQHWTLIPVGYSTLTRDPQSTVATLALQTWQSKMQNARDE